MDPSKNSSLLFIFVTIIVRCYSQDDEYTIPNFFKLRFTQASTMGIFVAIAVPVDLPGRNIYYSHFFELILNLPSNETSYEYPPLISRSGVNREMVYNIFEKKINSNGYPGKPCLLRLICEVAQSSVKEENGVLGEIIHIIFTPSSTINFDLPLEYEEAEIKGRNHDCLSYNENCTTSFLDLVTWAENQL